MRLPRLSPRQKAGLAVAFAFLLWAPSGISQESSPIVTGHSTFYNGDTYDKCLASIAGILRSRVMWFNDMVLTERYAGKGTFVYVTEDGADDPTTKNVLYTEGVFYDFVDPNGAHWHVEEAFYVDRYDYIVGGNDPINDPNQLDPTVDDASTRVYVWIVELAARPIHDQFAGADYHDLYNFLLLVDTCKMNRDHTAPYNLTHEGPALDTERGHPSGATAHEHEVHQINIWVGTRALLTPLGASTKGLEWQAAWATSGQATNNTGTAVCENGAGC